jgi:hypothetical protein
MTVVDSAAGELAAARERTGRRRIHGALVAALIVVLQLAWIGGIAYAAYLVVL